MNKLVNEIGINLVRDIVKILILINEIEDEMCLGKIWNGIFLVKLIIWLVYGIDNEKEKKLWLRLDLEVGYLIKNKDIYVVGLAKSYFSQGGIKKKGITY